MATGETVEEKTEGDWCITRHRTDSPVRMVGFNLGRYEREMTSRGGYTVEVYANRHVETALAQKRLAAVVLPPPSRAGQPEAPRWTVDLDTALSDNSGIKPAARLEQIALDVAGALEFMSSYFGPPALNHLTVTPIPGTFGQGFPGLIYLSTLAYLDPKQRPPELHSAYLETLYSEIMYAHETAHQWWGNVVTSASDDDSWIMEALANYSALLYLEKRKGARALDSVFNDYRLNLLAKDADGRTMDSMGPIIWGTRLINSKNPEAYRTITYEKGSWIIHMLRRRLGDERFLAMLGQLSKRYQRRSLSNDQFRQFVAGWLPPKSPDPQLESFFDQWVYATGIPKLKLHYSTRGAAPSVRVSGTITQTDVDDDFTTYVPVEIEMAGGKPIVHWVRTSSEPASFTVVLSQAPGKVLLDPGNSVLRR